MRARFTHALRLLTLALAAVCAVALNYRHVAVVQHVAAGTPQQPLTLSTGKRAVVVRERVSLESIHADVVTVAGPAVDWLPPFDAERDPLGAWLQTKTPTLGAAPTRIGRALAGAVPVAVRLLGASVAPQAP